MEVEDVNELRRKGECDEKRLEEKIHEAIRKNIRKYITEEALITGDGSKKVKIPIRGLNLPEFRFSPKGQQGIGTGRGKDIKEGDKVKMVPGPGAGQGEAEHCLEKEFTIDELVNIAFDELGLPDMEEMLNSSIISKHIKFNDIRKVGPISRLDIRRTLKSNIRRNAMDGAPNIGGITRDDLRFKSYNDVIEYRNNALIISMMDVSGSMDDFKKYLVRMTLWWIKKYLERIYDGLEFVFIIHDTRAEEVDEQKFFTSSTGGGTNISAAYELGLQVLTDRFPSSEWNIYAFHFSDGENWDNDNEKALDLATEIIERSRRLYYGQVGESSSGNFNKVLEERFGENSKLVVSIIKTQDEIVNGIERFLRQPA
jgi:sporulation protein YhbH